MSQKWILVAVVLCGSACSQETPDVNPGAAAAVETKPSAITKQAVEKEMAAADDGPDCETFLAEVRQACNDHYAKGLEVNCHTSITNVSIAIMQGKGELFVDPSGNNADMPAQAGAKTCAMMGKRMREQVAMANSTPPPASCVEMGKKLDAACFSKIGTQDYPAQCSGLLVTTTKLGPESGNICELTVAMAGELLTPK